MALPFLFLISCTPEPIPKVVNCIKKDLAFDYNQEAYSLDGQPWQDFDSQISIYIPDVGEAQFYIQTFELTFCPFLELDLETYSWALEDIGNPDGWWYVVYTTPEIFTEILNGKTVNGSFRMEAIAVEQPYLY